MRVHTYVLLPMTEIAKAKIRREENKWSGKDADCKVKACSHLSVVELSAVKITIKLQ